MSGKSSKIGLNFLEPSIYSKFCDFGDMSFIKLK